MSKEMEEYINYFYDNIVVKYSNYYNEVTSNNFLKSVFKKIDYKEIYNFYNLLYNELIDLIGKVKKTNEDLTKEFLHELQLFEKMINNEIDIYNNEGEMPIEELKKLRNNRIEYQNEFIKYDNFVFRISIVEHYNNN